MLVKFKSKNVAKAEHNLVKRPSDKMFDGCLFIWGKPFEKYWNECPGTIDIDHYLAAKSKLKRLI